MEAMRSEPVPPVPGPIVGNLSVVRSGVGSAVVIGSVSVGLSVGVSEGGVALLVEGSLCDVVDGIIM